MMARACFIAAEHPERGMLYAAFDPSARFVEGGVGGRKFAAFLAPFPDEVSARNALAEAGCRESVK